MMERLKMVKINDHIYLMNDADKTTGYIVIGDEKALIVDTMIGYENVAEIARTVTELPLIVVNTHGHLDHIGGNVYFEEVLMNPADLPVAKIHVQDEEYQKALREFHMKPAKFKDILPGDTIDLGGLVLEVYSVAGHTPGSIALLDRKDRILFSGDAIIQQIWLQLVESLPLKECLDNLKALQCIRGEYDYILSGHSRGLEDASLYEALMKGIEEVIQGKNENDSDYKWFQGVCKAHPYDDKNDVRKVVYQESK